MKFRLLTVYEVEATCAEEAAVEFAIHGPEVEPPVKLVASSKLLEAHTTAGEFFDSLAENFKDTLPPTPLSPEGMAARRPRP